LTRVRHGGEDTRQQETERSGTASSGVQGGVYDPGVLLAVSYHYVATSRPAAPRAIFPVAVDEFASQLDALARDFEFVSRDDVTRAVETGAVLPERSCLVTFDDGLQQQLDLALPVLEARGIPAVFFASGAPIAERRVAYVHKVHLLREHVGDDELRAAIERELRQQGVDVPDSSEPPAMYPYDTPEAAALKYLLNFVLGPTVTAPVDALFAASFSEEEVCGELYADEAGLARLEARGALGAHGYDHLPLATLDDARLRSDLQRSADVLASVTGVRPRMMSYPYGTAYAVDGRVARAAGEAGFTAALTMERAINRSLDEPLLLARVDTRDAPGGPEPRIAVDGADLVVDAPVTAGRSRYLQEAA
jgi:peptidoglycan/xylan/chitin deacetylase (PgdA/CDA1 family)